MKTIYTNIIGAFVVKDGNIVDERLFTVKEIRENYENLGKGETKQEQDLMAKHPDAKPGEAVQALKLFTEAKYMAKFREANLVVTKKKVALSVKIDNMITQAVSAIEETDKVANMMAKRLREWYELHNPEFSHSLEDHEKFTKLILTKPKKDLLKEIGLTEEESMGADLKDEDLKSIRELATETEALYALRKKQTDYVEKVMKENCPNVTAVAGATIGAKLMSIAGSLEKMALMPASTIQLLGAEKALFRHMTTGAKPPKFGVIINHPLVTKAKKPDKGKVARGLADKICLAAKIDYFKGEFRGDQLRKELEERFK